MGPICGGRHEVSHTVASPEVFYKSTSLGLIEVVLLLRGSSFQKSRGGKRPNPIVAFEAALEGVLISLQVVTWHLPSLAECLEAELELQLT